MNLCVENDGSKEPLTWSEYQPYRIRIESSARFKNRIDYFLLDLSGNEIELSEFRRSEKRQRVIFLSSRWIALSGFLRWDGIRDEIVFESDFEVQTERNESDWIVWDPKQKVNLRTSFWKNPHPNHPSSSQKPSFKKEEDLEFSEEFFILYRSIHRFLGLDRREGNVLQILSKNKRQNIVLNGKFSPENFESSFRYLDLFPLSSGLIQTFLGLKTHISRNRHYLSTKHGELLLSNISLTTDDKITSLFFSNKILTITNGEGTYKRFSRFKIDSQGSVAFETIAIRKIYNSLRSEEIFHTIHRIQNHIPVFPIERNTRNDENLISEKEYSKLLISSKKGNTYTLLLRLWTSEECEEKSMILLVGACLEKICDSKNIIFASFSDGTFILLFNFSEDKNQIDKIKDDLGRFFSAKHEIGTKEISFIVSMGISAVNSDQNTGIQESLERSRLILENNPIRGKMNFDRINSLLNERPCQLSSFFLGGEKSDRTLFYEYQPIIDLRTGEIALIESLARLKIGNRILYPNDFMDKRMDIDTLMELGKRSFADALRLIAALIQRGNFHTKIAINISPEQLAKIEFSESLIELAKSFSAEWRTFLSRIVIEITENSEIIDHEISRHTLNVLHSLGITFSLDDFGTGYSSFILLKSFPVEYIKIDKAFIKGVTENTLDRLIVNSIIDIGGNMELKVIAEGVENQKQFLYLLSIGVELIQGYHVFRPLREENILELLTYS
ncbi:EAL domain-containing protein [Leptospira sp. 201903070]|uniref:EAL domain-containing protein n=1 Tax=Leptospira ainlahdjerensis TaxID=2810033 RepID=A0ABS2U923_9LEPT|nr:EAL domain-containing protein [Leptospira ainlahdjerensis]MBM9576869.1 EAL domain-containing protein [Leptospira ainlahdjerensis]